MQRAGIERLTERQKECLRLLYARYEAKQIASQLGISHDRVHQHFKAARERLRVQRSMEAARLLCEFEAVAHSHNVVSPEIELPAPSNIVDEEHGDINGTVLQSHGDRSPAEPKDIFSPPLPAFQGFLWPFPTVGRRSNDLNWWQRLLAGLIIAFVAIAVVGAMKALQS
jgi:DNA-binding CsgD family transcriptional regulator